MSKGKRKSDPTALRIVQQRLQCRSTATFTEQDRALLMQLCRLDMIHILEVDLGLRPLKSQKNSVACMINYLLAQQHKGHDVDAVADTGAGVQQPSRPSQSRPQPGLSPAAAGLGGGSSSGGGSCPTPSTCPDDLQAQEPQQQEGVHALLPLLQAPPGALAAAAAAAAAAAPGVGNGSNIEQQPWLAELHEELEAAGAMRMRLGDATTDTDDDTTGTGATSSWVASQSGMEPFGLQDEQQYPAAAGGSQALAPGALDTSHIEEMLVQQLLLDIHSVPHRHHRAHKSSSFNSYKQQPPAAGAQQEVDEERRQPPLLLQQKLQQLEEQQRMLKEMQLQQEQQKNQLIQQQLEQQLQQQQQGMVQGVPAHADIECMLQDELLRELEARDSSQPLPPNLGSAISVEAQQLALAAAAADLPPSAATGPLALQQQHLHQHQQPTAQMASPPLPVVCRPHQGFSPEHTAAGGVMAAGGSGLPLHGLSDASLPLPGPAWGARRLSGQSAAGSSFTRKREKVLMGLPTVQDDQRTGAAIDPELYVEASGPSAELPTKRMSISLPGCAEVASLPTSFSGRVPSLSGNISRPQPAGSDLQQLMQFSAYEEPGDMLWQQPHPLQQHQQQGQNQQQQQLCGTQHGQQQAGVSGLGLASRLKALLRGKAKARRHSSVGAGGSFSTGRPAAAPDCNRVPSADAAYAYCTAMAAAGSSQPLPPLHQQQQQQQQQFQAACQPGAWAVAESILYRPTSNMPPAADGRQWHSAGMAVVPGDSSGTLQATVGGFSWHPTGSTLLAETGAAAAAPAGMMANSSHFAQQLAQLRADYAGQQQAGAGSSNVLQDRRLSAGGMGGLAGPSVVDRFVQALKVGSESAQGGPELAEEQEEDVLIMGRVGGGEAGTGRGF